MSNRSSIFTRHATTWMVVGIILVVALTYGDILNNYFTGADTFSQIDTARIRSLGDVGRIFSRPMMEGTTLLNKLLYFRPVTILSYSLDYAIWGLNPVGYHLTNLILHALVCAFLFFLMRILTNGNNTIALVTAILFAIHPAHVENVPTPARRHDMVTMAFMLPSLILFVRSRKIARLSIASLVFFVLALGSKEIAAILPFLIFAYCAIFSYKKGNIKTGAVSWLWGAFKPAIPYFAVTIAYVAWRSYVLGGLGGEVARQFDDSIEAFFIITSGYFGGLLEPYRLITGRPNLFFVVIALATALAWIWWRIYSHARLSFKTVIDPSRMWRILLFFFVWLLGPLAVLILTSSFRIRHLYTPAVAMCPILALVLVETLNAVREGLRALRSPDRGHKRLQNASLWVNAAMLLVLCEVCLALVVFSPLVADYDDWDVSGKMTERFLRRLDAIIPGLATDATLRINDLPGKVDPVLKRDRTRVRTPGGLMDWSIASWLNLNYPGNDFEVILHKRVKPEMLPSDFLLESEVFADIVDIDVGMLFPETARTVEDRLAIGKAYVEANEPGCAAYYLRSYLDSVPGDAFATSLLGEAFDEAGESDAAEGYFLQSLAREPLPGTYMSLSLHYRQSSDFEKTLELGEQWAADLPTDAAKAFGVMGWAYYGLKQYHMAATYFSASIGLDRWNSSYYGLCLTYIDGLDRSGEAWRVAQDWRLYEPDDPNMYLVLGLCRLSQRQYGRAIWGLEKSLELDVEAKRRALTGLGRSYMETGQFERARRTFVKWARRVPDEPISHSYVAEAYARMGKCAQARSWRARAAKAGLSGSRASVIDRVVKNCRDTTGKR